MAGKKPKDITGIVFGNLIALKRTTVKLKGRGYHWLCKCSCGNYHEASIGHLNSGGIKSCGCRQGIKDINITPEEAGAKQIYKEYKARSKRKNIEFKVTFKYFKKLTSSNCHYCGEKPNRLTNRNKFGKYFYNGIDRKDNNKGYINYNIVSCCTDCNFFKRSMNYKDFINKCKNITKYIENKYV